MVQFLLELSPDLLRHTASFLQCGVRAAAHLRALATLPTYYLTKFLRDDVRLNAFEATIVRAGVVRKYAI